MMPHVTVRQKTCLGIIFSGHFAIYVRRKSLLKVNAHDSTQTMSKSYKIKSTIHIYHFIQIVAEINKQTHTHTHTTCVWCNRCIGKKYAYFVQLKSRIWFIVVTTKINTWVVCNMSPALHVENRDQRVRKFR